MPSILNLKFKVGSPSLPFMQDIESFLSVMPHSFQGNKSFIAFSNLGDADALTKTWKVCPLSPLATRSLL